MTLPRGLRPAARLLVLLGAVWAVACGGEESAEPGPAASERAALPSESEAVPDDVRRQRPAPADRASNAPPTIEAVRFEPEQPTRGDSVRAVVEVSDPDGDSVWLEHAWSVDGRPVGGDVPRLLLRGYEKGDRIELEVTARDGVGASTPWHADTRIANAPPVLGRVRISPGEPIVAGEPIVVMPEASDGDGDPVRFVYQWKVNGLPQRESGSTLATDSLRRGDVVQVAVRASDGSDETEPHELPELTIANAPPRIVSSPGERPASAIVFYQVRAEDPDGDTGLQFELEGAPEGMSIDARTGVIRWQPQPGQGGHYTVTVIADDLQGGRGRQTIEVDLGDAPGGSAPAARRR